MYKRQLQLIVKDGLAEATTKINNLLHKCSALVATMHRSCKVTELLEEKHVAQIHTPNATRWNSKYEMIRGILEAEKKCEGILKQIADLTLCSCPNAVDLAILGELCDLLSVFAVATKNVETEETPTSSMVIPTIIGLEKALNRQQTRYATSVKTGLLVSLQKRSEAINSDEHFILSTVVEA